KLAELEAEAERVQHRLYEAIEHDLLPPIRIEMINSALRGLEKCWLVEGGLPERPWFRNIFAATDPYSGYAAWMFPVLRLGIEHRDSQYILDHVRLYQVAMTRLGQRLEQIDQAIPERAME
ncbi:MAG: hypothetical protein IH924_12750, partial [Proteobacteria bacterium]|nr:hypothetical protein [Pseudomonadota bacterium]